MIITRTPFRVSFAGGGSDMKEYYRQYGGAVLSVTIDKYVYLSMHPYFNANKIFLKYSQNELVDSAQQIKHRIIRQVFSEYGISGVDFNSSADIPSGTGLGSSSAFTSGLINLAHAYLEKSIAREAIAKIACEVEIDQLHEPIGKQDQYACAVGGLNMIEFKENEQVVVNKICMAHDAQRQLESNLMMFYLGNTRSASSILTEQKTNIVSNKSKHDNLHKMVRLAHDLQNELLHGNIDCMGSILHTGWMYKKELATQISNNSIDQYYETAIRAGALGGKLLGAGGGGFLLFYVPKEQQGQVRKSLSSLNELPFGFDYSGSTVVYADNQIKH